MQVKKQDMISRVRLISEIAQVQFHENEIENENETRKTLEEARQLVGQVENSLVFRAVLRRP